MSLFAFKVPGYFRHYGPIEANSLEAAKAEVRTQLGVKRLPRRIEVWCLDDRPMDRWRPVSEPTPLLAV